MEYEYVGVGQEALYPYTYRVHRYANFRSSYISIMYSTRKGDNTSDTYARK